MKSPRILEMSLMALGAYSAPLSSNSTSSPQILESHETPLYASKTQTVTLATATTTSTLISFPLLEWVMDNDGKSGQNEPTESSKAPTASPWIPLMAGLPNLEIPPASVERLVEPRIWEPTVTKEKVDIQSTSEAGAYTGEPSKLGEASLISTSILSPRPDPTIDPLLRGKLNDNVNIHGLFDTSGITGRNGTSRLLQNRRSINKTEQLTQDELNSVLREWAHIPGTWQLYVGGTPSAGSQDEESGKENLTENPSHAKRIPPEDVVTISKV